MAAAKKTPRSAASVIAEKIAASRAKARTDEARPSRAAQTAAVAKSATVAKSAAVAKSATAGKSVKTMTAKAGDAPRAAKAVKAPPVAKAHAAKPATARGARAVASPVAAGPLDLFATVPPPVAEAVGAMALQVEAAMADPVHAVETLEAPLRETQAQLREVVEGRLDETVVTFERWRAATQAGAAAFEANARSGAAAMRTLQVKLIEVAMAHTQAGLDLMQAMLVAPTLPDAVALQVEHVRKSAAAFATQSRDLAEIAQRVAFDVLAGGLDAKAA